MLQRNLSTVIMKMQFQMNFQEQTIFYSKMFKIESNSNTLPITHTLIELSPGATCHKPFVVIVPRATREAILC